MRLKQGIVRPGDGPLENEADVEIIDVSEYGPKRIPSRTWRECIKKIWEVDPLECPKCGGEMKIISFITEASGILELSMAMETSSCGLYILMEKKLDDENAKIF